MLVYSKRWVNEYYTLLTLHLFHFLIKIAALMFLNLISLVRTCWLVSVEILGHRTEWVLGKSHPRLFQWPCPLLAETIILCVWLVILSKSFKSLSNMIVCKQKISKCKSMSLHLILTFIWSRINIFSFVFKLLLLTISKFSGLKKKLSPEFPSSFSSFYHLVSKDGECVSHSTQPRVHRGC